MKTILKAIASGVIFSSMALSSMSVSAAGSGSFSLSPASGTKVKGQTFSVTLYENSSNVTVVSANLTYSAAAMQCTSVKGAGAFKNDVGSSCANGKVTISKYITPGAAGANGNQAVAVINFKALASTGTGSVSLTSGQIASDGTNTWNGGTPSASFTFKAPAPVAAPVAPTPAAPVETPAPAVLSDATKTESASTPTETNSGISAWAWGGIAALVVAAAGGAYWKFFREPAAAAVASAKKSVKRAAKA